MKIPCIALFVSLAATAQLADPADLRLYLAERGGLVALAPVYDRAGTAAVEELPVP